MANAWFREAARCGLIVELDMVTMTKALEALEWLPREVSLHINLAPETLFAGRGMELLDLVEPERVVVELTEHSDIADYAQLNRALAPLRERGVKLAVDDVGAGFSSLRHVLVLEPDVIKLDVSLCRGIDSNRVRRALARALTSIWAGGRQARCRRGRRNRVRARGAGRARGHARAGLPARPTRSQSVAERLT